MVDLACRRLPHLVCDVGVDVQRGTALPDDHSPRSAPERLEGIPTTGTLPLAVPLTQETSFEIEIVPLEGQKLTSPQAGGNLQQEQFITAVFLGLNQQTLNLVRSEHLHLPGLGVLVHATLSYCDFTLLSLPLLASYLPK